MGSNHNASASTPRLMTLRLMTLRLMTLLVLAFFVQAATAQDTVEFLSGAKLQGKVTAIHREAKKITFESKLGTRTISRDFRYAQIHAIVYRGKRFVLTPKPAAAPAGPSARPGTRSKAEIERLIDSVGSTPPDWLDATNLNLPNTLDLSWPLKPPNKGWRNQENIGQFYWDIINPNPNRWKEGVKLVYTVMPRHQNDPALLRRDRMKLGSIYFELFQDYPRAAYWFRQARIAKTEPASVTLAECYWRMGSKPMALEQLKSRTLTMNAIKLYGDMGDTKTAVQFAVQAAKSQPHQAYLLAGDACRVAGRFDDAIGYYNKVLNAGAARNKDYEKRFKSRARESIEAIELFDKADPKRVSTGTYRASTTGYSGPVEVEVQVSDGKIEAVRVLRHQEKQFYAALTDTPNQILKKQSVKGVDATTRATITSQAIVNATAKALAQGAR